MSQKGRKFAMVLAALAPVVAVVFIASQLFDLRKAADDARVWAIGMLGGAAMPLPGADGAAPGNAPGQPGSGGLPPEEAGRQMDNAYAELVKELAPQVVKEQICIEQGQGKLEIRFMEQVLFDTASARVTREGQDILAKTGQALSRIKGRPFTILGHTDNRPIQTDLYPSNWELSTARACSVVRFLTEKAEIAPERFFAVGRADFDPVADNATDAGRYKNRRVEILVTDLECLTLPSRAARKQ